MFRNIKLQRRIAAVVLIAFSNLTLYPLSASAQARDAAGLRAMLASVGEQPSAAFGGAAQPGARPVGEAGIDPMAQGFSALLAGMHDDAKSAIGHGKAAQAARPAPAGKVAAILERAGRLRGLYGEAERRFQDQEQQLRAAGGPRQLLDRHAETVTEYGRRKAQFERLVAALEQAGDNPAAQQDALTGLNAFLSAYPNARRHQPLDPNRLANRTPAVHAPAAIDSADDYAARLFPPSYDGIRLASAGAALQLAPNSLPAVPAPEDTAATEDVQITQPIRDLAAQLRHNPVEIYNWVRNNIVFMPTYGSIQGSELTLENRRGNAFDTASLLIALYRASGIAARYAYGTIEVPAAQVMNWVGGAPTPAAAQSLLGQGGVPATALVGGGAIRAFRLEHVWVEAFVAFHPARGALQRAPDTWVPLDAAFKQYDFAAPVDAAAILAFDQEALRARFLSGATVAADGNRLSGADSRRIGLEVEDYQHKLMAWANGVGHEQAAARLRRQLSVRPQAPSILLGSLPYKVVAKASTFRAIPADLRWRVTIGYYASEMEMALESPIFEHSLSLARIGNRKLGLGFAPASDADAATLQALKAQRATSLPAYSLRGIARLTLDDAVLASGAPAQLGSQRIAAITVHAPRQSASVDVYQMTLGDETVLSLNAAGITQATLDSRFARTASLTASENLHTVGTVFWLLTDMHDELLAAALGVSRTRLPSIGAFTAPLNVSYFFGIPRTASYQGRYADVKRVLSAATAADGAIPVAFMRQSGIMGSNFEGLAFDLTFQREVGSGGSAVRLLKRALDGGGAVHRITAANAAALDALALSADVKADIANAVAAGKEALVSDAASGAGAWSGTGYIISDPATGAAAYLIDGGFNGGTDDAGCGGEPATEPASQSVAKPILYVAAALALVVLVIIALPFIIELAVAGGLVGGMLAASTATAATPPGGLLSPGAQAAWDATFGRLGPFPGGPYPGENLPPPGDCSVAQHDQLAAEKAQLCGKPSKCNKNECDQALIQERIANRNACIEKRIEIMMTCFRGGDSVHWDQVSQLLNGLATCRGCLAKAIGGQCKP